MTPAVISLRLTWRDNDTLPARFMILEEHERGEPPFYSLWMCASDWKTFEDHAIESPGGYGARGKAQAKKVAQRLADLTTVAPSGCLLTLGGEATGMRVAEHVAWPVRQVTGDSHGT